MKRVLGLFILRWIFNVFGIWLAVRVFGTGYVDTPEGTAAFVLAGLVFSLVNSFVKPIVVLLSLPLLLVTFGMFMIVINGFIVFLTFTLLPSVDMTFWHAILTGVVMSLVNYILSGLLEVQYTKRQKGD